MEAAGGYNLGQAFFPGCQKTSASKCGRAARPCLRWHIPRCWGICSSSSARGPQPHNVCRCLGRGRPGLRCWRKTALLMQPTWQVKMAFRESSIPKRTTEKLQHFVLYSIHTPMLRGECKRIPEIIATNGKKVVTEDHSLWGDWLTSVSS